MRYGVDVALRRADDLDKILLREVATRVARGDVPLVLDIGAGGGGQSRRLAELGAKVTAIDILDYTKEFDAINSEINPANPISFIEADIANWIKTIFIDFDYISFQRTLHYLPYLKAKELLSTLRQKTKHALYISTTGASSAIAKEYEALDLVLDERFGFLSAPAQETFSITAPLCVYHEHELVSLLEVTGWKITWLRVSDFGNIKVVAVPK